ncbi:MAG: hypothetical protein ABI851_13575 [Saprospiraceae bacterium]
MKSLYNFVLCTFLVSCILPVNKIFSQCGLGKIILNRQGEVDSFSINYPNCHHLLGDLVIRSSAIENLEGLEQIDSIDQTFEIVDNQRLQNLEGLRNLQFVETMIIDADSLITELSGLRNLRNASNALAISNLPKITNLTGLNRLKNTRQFLIYSCKNIQNLIGLDSFETTTTINISANENLDSLLGFVLLVSNSVDHFRIGECPKLRSLIPMPNLSYIYNLHIFNNSSLNNLAGLDSVRENFYFQLENNEQLTDLSALKQLTKVKKYLRIINNEKLEDLGGLVNVDLNNLDSLVIVDNDHLAFCNQTNICSYLSDSSHFARIESNALNCENRAQVESNCTNLKFELLEFNALLQNGKVNLDWISINENNIKSIGLQRMIPNANWEVLESDIKAFNHLAGKNYYQYLDPNPATGLNSYRLIIEDKNGIIEYSKIISIQVINTGTTNYSINQQEGKLQFQFDEGIKSLSLVNLSGISSKFDNLNKQIMEINLLNSIPGWYCYIIQLESGTIIQGKIFISNN